MLCLFVLTYSNIKLRWKFNTSIFLLYAICDLFMIIHCILLNKVVFHAFSLFAGCVHNLGFYHAWLLLWEIDIKELTTPLALKNLIGCSGLDLQTFKKPTREPFTISCIIINSVPKTSFSTFVNAKDLCHSFL